MDTSSCAVLVLFLSSVSCATNNVCETFEDYEKMEVSPNCWYNPDVNSDVPEMVKRNGYPLETYELVTEDDYILTMFRIPPRNTARGVVLLEHPLSAYSGVWLDKGNHSLGYILADAGYDVWMANVRGTHHSLRHLKYTSSDKEYWNFTFHEVGLYDLQAELKFVYKKTGRNDIAFISHSMGSTSALIYASLRPEDARRFVKVFIAMSPPAYFAHVRSPSRHFNELITSILEIMDEFGLYSIQHNSITKEMVDNMCLNQPHRKRLCINLLQFIMGWNPSEVYPPWVPVMFSQNPGGTNTKSMHHYVQEYEAEGRFQFFDYGTELNQIYYQRPKPPEYPIKNITVPFYIMYGLRDDLTTPKDTIKLYEDLRPEAKIYGIHAVDYNHIDFMYARTVKRKVYDHIVTLLDKIYKSKKGRK